jgi:hypothetical protein
VKGALLLVGLIIVGVVLGIMAYNLIDSYVGDSTEAA